MSSSLQKRKGSRFHASVVAAIFAAGIVLWLVWPESKKPAPQPVVRNVKAQVPAASKKAQSKAADAMPKKVWAPATEPKLTANVKPPKIRTDEQLRFRKNCERFFGKQIFTQPSDNIICGVISARPGTNFLPIEIGEQFEKDFRESLNHPIELKDDDTPEERAMKEDVIDARKYLQEAVERGESAADLVRTAREEVDKITEYRTKLHDNLMLLLQGGSEQDVQQYLDESNEMLKEYDAIPLHISKFGWKKLKKRLEAEAAGEPRKVPRL